MQAELIQGQLVKKSQNNILKPWQKRYFCLRDQGQSLLYFSKRPDKKNQNPNGRIEIRNAKIIADPDDQLKFRILFITRNFQLVAKSKEERDRWVSSLLKAQKFVQTLDYDQSMKAKGWKWKDLRAQQKIGIKANMQILDDKCLDDGKLKELNKKMMDAKGVSEGVKNFSEEIVQNHLLCGFLQKKGKSEMTKVKKRWFVLLSAINIREGAENTKLTQEQITPSLVNSIFYYQPQPDQQGPKGSIKISQVTGVSMDDLSTLNLGKSKKYGFRVTARVRREENNKIQQKTKDLQNKLKKGTSKIMEKAVEWKVKIKSKFEKDDKDKDKDKDDDKEKGKEKESETKEGGSQQTQKAKEQEEKNEYELRDYHFYAGTPLELNRWVFAIRTLIQYFKNQNLIRQQLQEEKEVLFSGALALRFSSAEEYFPACLVMKRNEMEISYRDQLQRVNFVVSVQTEDKKKITVTTPEKVYFLRVQKIQERDFVCALINRLTLEEEESLPFDTPIEEAPEEDCEIYIKQPLGYYHSLAGVKLQEKAPKAKEEGWFSRMTKRLFCMSQF